MYIEHLRKAYFFLELPLDDLFIQFEQRLPRDFQWSDSEGSECLNAVVMGHDRVIYLALLKGMSYEVRTRRIMCVDVVNARRKLVEIRDRATGAYGPRSYLAFRSSLLKLLLPGLFLGDASPNRCQGLPRERTEQTSFFL